MHNDSDCESGQNTNEHKNSDDTGKIRESIFTS